MLSRGMVAVAVLTSVGAATATGCGLGPGDEADEEATLTVTRDYGTRSLVKPVSERPSKSTTVMRFLDTEADITTRYGGGFVQSIEGLSGTARGGRTFDWFFYVNGIESGKGAAQFTVRGGDRVWWDYRDWTSAMRVPAVVGSFPEPFLHGYDGKRWDVVVACRTAHDPCDDTAVQLSDEGIAARVVTGSGGEGQLRVLVGAWAKVREDETAALIEDGPGSSGVFARFEDRGRRLVLLDPRGETSRSFGPGAGLVATVRPGDGPPTWVVTGTDNAGVRAAIELLDPADLRDRYAVAVSSGGQPTGVPVP